MLELQVQHAFNSAIALRVTSPQDLHQLFLQPQRSLQLTSDLRIAHATHALLFDSLAAALQAVGAQADHNRAERMTCTGTRSRGWHKVVSQEPACG
jgi:hypothetical protein